MQSQFVRRHVQEHEQRTERVSLHKTTKTLHRIDFLRVESVLSEVDIENEYEGNEAAECDLNVNST
jgi:hypothetical protein